jgi:DHA1 family bicyclomycin/chloramphenicol resistance-like MFS transporter
LVRRSASAPGGFNVEGRAIDAPVKIEGEGPGEGVGEGVAGELYDGLARAARPPLGLVLLLGAMTAFAPLSIDMYLPSLPAIGADLHAAPAAMQQTVAAFFVGMAVGQLFYGPLSDRVGRRGPLLIGLIAYVAATTGCALARSESLLVVLRVGQALAGCGGMVIARAIVRDRFHHSEVLHIFSLLTLVMGLAPILAPLLGGWILAVGGWRWIFGFQAAFGAAVSVAAFYLLPESRSEATAAHARGESPLRSYVELLKQPRLLGFVLTGAFSGAALFAYVAASPDILIAIYHVPPSRFGLFFGVNAAGLIAATQLNARLARRVPFQVILGWANLAVFGCGLVLALDAVTGLGGLWGVMIPVFLIMSGYGFSQSNATVGALGVDPLRSGAISSLFGAATFGAGASSAALAGVLRDGTARPMAFVIAGAALCAVISLRTLAPARRPD